MKDNSTKTANSRETVCSTTPTANCVTQVVGGATLSTDLECCTTSVLLATTNPPTISTSTAGTNSLGKDTKANF